MKESNMGNLHDKQKLGNDVERKIKTTMVGALASFEENFGYLWGHDKPENEPLTEDEEANLANWEYIRNEILDRGHSQIRAIKHELENYDIEWQRYKYHFKFRRED